MKKHLALLCLFTLGGCAKATSYAGIPLSPGAAARELQQLARAARSGNKQAQLELAQRLEHGTGIKPNRDAAIVLYRAAAADSGGTRIVFVPQRSGSIRAVPINSGNFTPGLRTAKLRLQEPTRQSEIPIISGTSATSQSNSQADGKNSIKHERSTSQMAPYSTAPDHVSMMCGITTVHLTCNQRDGQVCVSSFLTFGRQGLKSKRVPGDKFVPQRFERAKLTAKSLSCVHTKRYTYISVIYNFEPAYSANTEVLLFDLSGNVAKNTAVAKRKIISQEIGPSLDGNEFR